MKRSSALAVALLAATQVSCGDAGSNLGFGVKESASLQALVYFDRDGSGSLTAADTVRSGILVRLVRIGITQPVDSDTTSAVGVVVFKQVDPGYYAAVVDSSFLDDSIVATRAPTTATVRAGGQPVVVQIGLAPPVVTIRQLKLGTVGQVVIVHGVIRAGLQSYSDTSAYITDTSGSLRMQRVRNADGTTVNHPGDVITARGRIALFNGQHVLDSARVFTVGAIAEAPPDTLTSSLAALANGGVDDADLVRVVGAIILDTATVSGAFTVGVSDGSGTLVVVLDPRLGATPSQFALGSALDATGVLVPTSSGSWQLWPRTTDDFLIH